MERARMKLLFINKQTLVFIVLRYIVKAKLIEKR